MIASVSNKQLAIGTWTSAANENTGTIVEFPASNNRPKRTYMYVKFVKGSGSDLYQGTPVGITTEADGAGEIVISADQSAVIGTAFIGVAVSGSTTAVTTAYYGWIQLARPYEVLGLSCAFRPAEPMSGSTGRLTAISVRLRHRVCLALMPCPVRCLIRASRPSATVPGSICSVSASPIRQSK